MGRDRAGARVRRRGIGWGGIIRGRIMGGLRGELKGGPLVGVDDTS